MRIKLVTDSACDLPLELQVKYEIDILPLHIQKENRSFLDMIEITLEDIFEYGDQTGKLCSTSSINVVEFADAFTRYSREYDAVICISIGAQFSSCYQNAVIAAGFAHVYIVDSQNLSSGEALIVLAAAQMAEAGLSPEAICTALEETVKRTDSSFLLSRLDYMKKGGRCSAVASLGANLLQLKPCIEVRDGRMQVWKKFRGSMKKALEQYILERLSLYEPAQPLQVIIVYHPEDKFFLGGVRDALRAGGRSVELWEASYGCTVACHCGPGTVGVMILPQ